MLEQYWIDVIPAKAPRTQADNEDQRAWLLRFFNDPPAPLENIEPVHVRQYLDWSVKTKRAAAEARNAQRRKDGKPPIAISAKHGQVQANREKALFSHVFNYARDHGYTFGIAEVFQQYDEFVAPETGHRIALAHALLR